VVKTHTDRLTEAQGVVRDVSGVVTNGIREISAGSEEIRASMTSLESQNAALRVAIDALNEQVNRFKTTRTGCVDVDEPAAYETRP
jgi:methyl-accepting chemotaxis protein